MGTAEAITLLLAILDRAQTWGAIVQQAQSENRDLTAAEVDGFAASATASEQRLKDAIAKAKAEGR